MKMFFILLLCASVAGVSSCKNRKTEIVEALKVARKHVANGNARLEAIADILSNEAKMIAAGMKYKRTG